MAFRPGGKFFYGSPLEERVFENASEQDADGIEARVTSISFIASLDERELARVRERARAIAGPGRVTIPYRTEVHTCRRGGRTSVR